MTDQTLDSLPRILVTGATGFVGRALCEELLASGYRVTAAVRRKGLSPLPMSPLLTVIEVGEIGSKTNWTNALQNIDVVIHLAARVHMMADKAGGGDEPYLETNALGTERLALAAAEQGVKRMIFVSSIKVNGEATTEAPFSSLSVPSPQDAYGRSKWEAEQRLKAVAANSAMEFVIIRPPLVYGGGVKANFASLVRWVDRCIPLPLACIHNKRSLVALANLVDLICVCIAHPAAANQTFLVSDGEDLSTAQLLRRVAKVLGRPSMSFPVPEFLLSLGARLLGRSDMFQRLSGSLQIDMDETQRVLGWHPPCTVDEGLCEVVRAYRRAK